ncbi:MAG: GIY-YIG nuclease [Edafosvirus sp.]|uniref:GIY-YIG nuclease n=1 Tax=Edafosvirus sp. TaxID=2487765 RepID=A0A3G4ZVW7_9VIRU|nr:MAG: GIY-YIG nuclease [Edafosvirus sp.]
MVNLYVFRLQYNKYYVGLTDERVEDLYLKYVNETLDDIEWMVKYKPIGIVETYKIKDTAEEDKKTLHYMALYEIDNVRGGSFSSFDISDDETRLIKKLMKSNFNKCFKCDKADHFAYECPPVKPVIPEIDVNLNTTLILSQEVNLFELLQPKFIGVGKEMKFPTYNILLFENIIGSKYVKHVNFDCNNVNFLPVMGMGAINAIICSEDMYSNVDYTLTTLNLNNFINLERLFILINYKNGYRNVPNAAIDIIDDKKTSQTDVVISDTEAIIEYSLTETNHNEINIKDVKEKNTKGNPVYTKGNPVYTKGNPVYTKGNPVYQSTYKKFHYKTIIKTNKKIEVYIIDKPQYDLFIKEALD